MKKSIRLGKSPITNTIYAGHLNKAGTQWIGEKQDVTEDFHNVMGQVIPLNGGFRIDNENGETFVFSQFPVTFDGITAALEMFNKMMYQLTVLEQKP